MQEEANNLSKMTSEFIPQTKSAVVKAASQAAIDYLKSDEAKKASKEWLIKAIKARNSSFHSSASTSHDDDTVNVSVTDSNPNSNSDSDS